MTLEMALSEREMQGFEKGIEQGIVQGIEQGIVQGIEQGQNSIALNMLQLKISFDLIQKSTGLSMQKIHELSKKIS